LTSFRVPYRTLFPDQRSGRQESFVTIHPDAQSFERAQGVSRPESWSSFCADFYEANAFVHQLPVQLRIPFEYSRIPAPLRIIARNLLAWKNESGKQEGFVFAEEFAAHHWLDQTSAGGQGQGEEFRSAIYPKRFAFLLSHDIDTLAGMKNVPRLMELEARYGIKSAYYFVTHRYPLDHGLLKALQDQRHEIGVHDFNHDNRIAFLPPTEIRRRFDTCRRALKDFEINGFRSPAFIVTPGLRDVIGEYFEYDSSWPDVSLAFPKLGFGCYRWFPYRHPEAKGKCLLELPVTLPRDGELRALRYSPSQIGDLWVKKLEAIKEAAGLAFLLTHPEPGFSDSPEMLDALEKVLKIVSSDHDVWLGTPVELSRIMNKQKY
jgi:peptidoglycan/xylan/chitin deacetylase (PgdA/CDA1 family)